MNRDRDKNKLSMRKRSREKDVGTPSSDIYTEDYQKIKILKNSELEGYEIFSCLLNNSEHVTLLLTVRLQDFHYRRITPASVASAKHELY